MANGSTSDAGPVQQQRRLGPLYEVGMKVVFPIMLLVGTGATGMVLAHESRLTVLETRSELETRQIRKDLRDLKDDICELKADMKKLLEANRGG